MFSEIEILMNIDVCLAGLLRPDEGDPSQEDGGQQGEEREEKKQKFGQEDSREMLYFIVANESSPDCLIVCVCVCVRTDVCMCACIFMHTYIQYV